MTSVKRLGALFLLMVFVFNSVGPFLKFVLLHQKIVHQMQEYIFYHSKKELYTVTVNEENAHLLRWHHQKEFSYHGMMFDVVEKVLIDEQTTEYHCVADYKETVLFENLDRFIRKDASPKAHLKIPKVHLFQQSLPEKQNLVLIPQPNWEKYTKKQWLYHLHYLSPLLVINSPPPELG